MEKLTAALLSCPIPAIYGLGGDSCETSRFDLASTSSHALLSATASLCSAAASLSNSAASSTAPMSHTPCAVAAPLSAVSIAYGPSSSAACASDYVAAVAVPVASSWQTGAAVADRKAPDSGSAAPSVQSSVVPKQTLDSAKEGQRVSRNSNEVATAAVRNNNSNSASSLRSVSTSTSQASVLPALAASLAMASSASAISSVRSSISSPMALSALSFAASPPQQQHNRAVAADAASAASTAAEATAIRQQPLHEVLLGSEKVMSSQPAVASLELAADKAKAITAAERLAQVADDSTYICASDEEVQEQQEVAVSLSEANTEVFEKWRIPSTAAEWEEELAAAVSSGSTRSADMSSVASSMRCRKPKKSMSQRRAANRDSSFETQDFLASRFACGSGDEPEELAFLLAAEDALEKSAAAVAAALYPSLSRRKHARPMRCTEKRGTTGGASSKYCAAAPAAIGGGARGSNSPSQSEECDREHNDCLLAGPADISFKKRKQRREADLTEEAARTQASSHTSESSSSADGAGVSPDSRDETGALPAVRRRRDSGSWGRAQDTAGDTEKQFRQQPQQQQEIDCGERLQHNQNSKGENMGERNSLLYAHGLLPANADLLEKGEQLTDGESLEETCSRLSGNLSNAAENVLSTPCGKEEFLQKPSAVETGVMCYMPDEEEEMKQRAARVVDVAASCDKDGAGGKKRTHTEIEEGLEVTTGAENGQSIEGGGVECDQVVGSQWGKDDSNWVMPLQAYKSLRWREGFSLPLGKIGRQKLLRQVRVKYHRNRDHWRAKLHERGFDVTSLPRMGVEQLWAVAHQMDLFHVACMIAHEHATRRQQRGGGGSEQQQQQQPAAVCCADVGAFAVEKESQQKHQQKDDMSFALVRQSCFESSMTKSLSQRSQNAVDVLVDVGVVLPTSGSTPHGSSNPPGLSSSSRRANTGDPGEEVAEAEAPNCSSGHTKNRNGGDSCSNSSNGCSMQTRCRSREQREWKGELAGEDCRTSVDDCSGSSWVSKKSDKGDEAAGKPDGGRLSAVADPVSSRGSETELIEKEKERSASLSQGCVSDGTTITTADFSQSVQEPIRSILLEVNRQEEQGRDPAKEAQRHVHSLQLLELGSESPKASTTTTQLGSLVLDAAIDADAAPTAAAAVAGACTLRRRRRKQVRDEEALCLKEARRAATKRGKNTEETLSGSRHSSHCTSPSLHDVSSPTPAQLLAETKRALACDSSVREDVGKLTPSTTMSNNTENVARSDSFFAGKSEFISGFSRKKCGWVDATFSRTDSSGNPFSGEQLESAHQLPFASDGATVCYAKLGDSNVEMKFAADSAAHHRCRNSENITGRRSRVLGQDSEEESGNAVQKSLSQHQSVTTSTSASLGRFCSFEPVHSASPSISSSVSKEKPAVVLSSEESAAGAKMLLLESHESPSVQHSAGIEQSSLQETAERVKPDMESVFEKELKEEGAAFKAHSTQFKNGRWLQQKMRETLGDAIAAQFHQRVWKSQQPQSECAGSLKPSGDERMRKESIGEGGTTDETFQLEGKRICSEDRTYRRKRVRVEDMSAKDSPLCISCSDMANAEAVAAAHPDSADAEGLAGFCFADVSANCNCASAERSGMWRLKKSRNRNFPTKCVMECLSSSINCSDMNGGNAPLVETAHWGSSSPLWSEKQARKAYDCLGDEVVERLQYRVDELQKELNEVKTQLLQLLNAKRGRLTTSIVSHASSAVEEELKYCDAASLVALSANLEE